MADTILDRIAEYTRARVDAEKRKTTPAAMRALAEQLAKEEGQRAGFAFEEALRGEDLAWICECKKASPSRGLIAPDFPYLEIAKEYEQAGASCISVLTEPRWFLGRNEYLRQIASQVKIPCLRKDFTIDEYMIWEAKTLGAKAVLLICSLLESTQLRAYLKLCEELHLSALVEAHDEAEIADAVAAGARIIGVNNRNLKNFTVDVHNSQRLRSLVPPQVLFVAESGIKSAEDVAALRAAKVDAVLIGETLMRAPDKRAMLEQLRGKREERTRIKLCGLSREEDIECANRLQPDYIGFVFAPGSRRYVPPKKAARLRSMLDPSIKSVGVFVNEEIQVVAQLLEEGVIDVAQLHGTEEEDYLARLRRHTSRPILKAFRVESKADITLAGQSSAWSVLVDHGPGGTGEAFDWSLLKELHRPYFLAGGLNPSNVGRAVQMLHPFAVDVSSGVETDGVKDPEKMEAFVKAVREANEPE